MNERVGLRGVEAAFYRGEITLIKSEAGPARKAFLRLLAGQTHPDRGRVVRSCDAAPPPGVAWGFPANIPVRRSLEVRAGFFGVCRRAYVARLAEHMKDPRALSEPFSALGGRDRALITFLSAWLLPAEFFVFDPRPAPTDPELRDLIEPYWRAAREGAALVGLIDHKMPIGGFAADHVWRLESGRLVHE